MTTTYHAVDERGRIAEASSLQFAAWRIAVQAGRAPRDVVTAQVSPDRWYVYANDAALAVDLQRGPVGPNSPGWFAQVSVTST